MRISLEVLAVIDKYNFLIPAHAKLRHLCNDIYMFRLGHKFAAEDPRKKMELWDVNRKRRSIFAVPRLGCTFVCRKCGILIIAKGVTHKFESISTFVMYRHGTVR